jgi:hypothetical protein
MKRLLLTVLLACSVAAAQQQPVSPARGLTPWYEKGWAQLTQNKPDLGAAIEERRRIFLDASVRSRYFWFGLASAALNVVLFGLFLFKRRELEFKLNQAAGWIADLWNQDQSSRAAAREAITRYNRHIKLCNRVVESERTGEPTPATVQQGDAASEFQRLSSQLANEHADRLRIQADLDNKTRQVQDYSIRIQELERRVDEYTQHDVSGAGTSVELIRRINALEQELTHYRQNSKPKAVRG